MNCTLTYIPQRLHWGNKETLIAFQIADIIYRRCKPKELENPYATVTPLWDISHNIGTCCGIQLSEESDVLYSIKEDEEVERYDKLTFQLRIKSLNENSIYSKEFVQVKDNINYIGKLELIHDPTPCMYPHCIFRIWVNDVKVDRDNYRQGLKKLNKLKNDIRQELSIMIFRGEIDQNRIITPL